MSVIEPSVLHHTCTEARGSSSSSTFDGNQPRQHNLFPFGAATTLRNHPVLVVYLGRSAIFIHIASNFPHFVLSLQHSIIAQEEKELSAKKYQRDI